MKKFLATLLALVMLLGCAPMALAADVTEITLWSIYTGDDYAIIQGVVDAFNAANPDVKVTHLAMAADSDLYVKMPLVSGDDSAAPHLVIMHNRNIGVFAKQGVVQPIKEFLTAYGDFSENQYYGIDAGYFDGTQYGIPFCAPTACLYVNNALAAEYCPEVVADGIVTWDEVYAVADKLLADGVTDVKALGGSFPRNDMLGTYYTLGGEFSEDGVDVKLMKDKLIEAVNLWKGLNDKGALPAEEDDIMGMFALEELIFMTGGTWNLSAVKEYGLEFTMLPFVQVGTENMRNLGATECFVKMNRSFTEAEQIACLRLMEFCRENAMLWAESGAIVAAKATRDSEEFKALPQGSVTSTGAVTWMPSYMYATAIMNVVNSLGTQPVYGHITPEEYADTVELQSQQLVDGMK